MLLSPPVHPFPSSPQFSPPDTGTLYFPVIYSAGPKGGGGWVKGHVPPPPEEAPNTLKSKQKKNLITAVKRWTLGLKRAHRAASVTRACRWDFKISCSLVGRTKHCCAPSQSQTELGNLGWMHLSPVTRLWYVCPLPHLPFRCCFDCKFHVV